MCYVVLLVRLLRVLFPSTVQSVIAYYEPMKRFFYARQGVRGS